MGKQVQDAANAFGSLPGANNPASIGCATPQPTHAPQNTSSNFLGQQGQDDVPTKTIYKLALAFTTSLHIRFGQNARETATIYGTLGRFGRGEIPKRDTLSIVAAVLDGHDDLKHELMATLHHKDSQWGPGDFDFSLLNLAQSPLPQAAPLFLQPDNKLNLRLPSMSALFDSHQQEVAHPVDRMMSNWTYECESYETTETQEHSLIPIEHENWQAPSRTGLFTPKAPTSPRTVRSIELTLPGVEHTATHTFLVTPVRKRWT